MAYVYLVKFSPNAPLPRRGNYVGIFVVSTPGVLPLAVKEFARPSECVCRKISDASIPLTREAFEPDEDGISAYCAEVDSYFSESTAAITLANEFESGGWDSVVPMGYEFNGQELIASAAYRRAGGGMKHFSDLNDGEINGMWSACVQGAIDYARRINMSGLSEGCSHNIYNALSAAIRAEHDRADHKKYPATRRALRIWNEN